VDVPASVLCIIRCPEVRIQTVDRHIERDVVHEVNLAKKLDDPVEADWLLEAVADSLVAVRFTDVEEPLSSLS
jgi:hypothetical protein